MAQPSWGQRWQRTNTVIYAALNTLGLLLPPMFAIYAGMLLASADEVPAIPAWMPLLAAVCFVTYLVWLGPRIRALGRLKQFIVEGEDVIFVAYAKSALSGRHSPEASITGTRAANLAGVGLMGVALLSGQPYGSALTRLVGAALIVFAAITYRYLSRSSQTDQMNAAIRSYIRSDGDQEQALRDVATKIHDLVVVPGRDGKRVV